MHFTWIIFKENIMDVSPPPKPKLLLYELVQWVPLFEIMKNSFMLIKNRENWKIIWRSKKICESAYLKGIVASLLKMKFLVTLNPKEGRRKWMT